MKATVQLLNDEGKVLYSSGLVDEIHFGLNLQTFVEAYFEGNYFRNLENFLREKYEGYNGVPFCQLLDAELLLDEKDKRGRRLVKNWVEAELEQRIDTDTTFVPFELATEIIASKLKEEENDSV